MYVLIVFGINSWNTFVSDDMSLQAWLAVDPEPPDVYVIGFQELDLRNIIIFTYRG